MPALSSHPVRILHIEDCKSDVMLFRHLLGTLQNHCNITDVPRLIDAFKMIDGDAFNLIVLDLNLIDLDGVANIAALKAQCPRVPVLVYSGRGDSRLKIQAQTYGAAGYIVKGETDATLLQSTVATALAS